ncbi:hypothetical protein GCM10020367_17700 [Streptomyces sannanensis]|uniref:DUF397 domain-containing protein n=1 Tax=Streptomyces sannanensis TaxID=285536 RepID=A0ABP6S8G5_9ACTN
MSTLQWRKSSYSGDGSNCVCVAVSPDGTVLLRDSKAPETTVTTTPHALRALIAALASERLGPSPSVTSIPH